VDGTLLRQGIFMEAIKLALLSLIIVVPASFACLELWKMVATPAFPTAGFIPEALTIGGFIGALIGVKLGQQRD
jgi:hypothetical protein